MKKEEFWKEVENNLDDLLRLYNEQRSSPWLGDKSFKEPFGIRFFFNSQQILEELLLQIARKNDPYV